MLPGYKTYTSRYGQSYYDVCLNTYGTLDLMIKLLQDNNVTSIAYHPTPGTVFQYDPTLVDDQKLVQAGYTFATATYISLPDQDVLKYIAAVNSTGYIMNATERAGVANFVSLLKQNGLWKRSSDFAIYPKAGNTADSQKFNLLNPVDSDAAFRLTWHGSPTHNALGAKGNGSSQYAFTHINAKALGASPSNISLSVWTQESTATYVAGVYDGGNWGVAAVPSYTDGYAYYAVSRAWDFVGSIPAGTPKFANANGSGLFTISRTGNTSEQAYQNGVLVNSTASGAGNLPNDTFSFLAVYRDNGSGSASGFTQYSSNTISFGAVMAGMTATQSTIFYNAVYTLMVAFGRA